MDAIFEGNQPGVMDLELPGVMDLELPGALPMREATIFWSAANRRLPV